MKQVLNVLLAGLVVSMSLFLFCIFLNNPDEKITEEVFTYETCAGITHDVAKVSYKVHYTGNFNDEFPYEETKCAQLVMNYSFMKSVMDYTFKELVENDNLKVIITNNVTNEVLKEFSNSDFKIISSELVFHKQFSLFSQNKAVERQLCYRPSFFVFFKTKWYPRRVFQHPKLEIGSAPEQESWACL